MDELFTVIAFDGNGPWYVKGVASKAVLVNKFPELEIQRDGVILLTGDARLMAIPHNTKSFEPSELEN